MQADPAVRITGIRPSAVVTADGREHPVDTIIWGTGFRATEFLVPKTVTGSGGCDLGTQWRDGAEAYLGVQAVRRLAAGAATVEVRPEVQQRFVEWVQRRITETVWDRGCTSWYRTSSGRNTNNWPDFTFAYRARTRRFDPSAYVLTPAER